MRIYSVKCSTVFLIALSVLSSAAFGQISISGVGAYSPPGAPEGLSGLTYAGGNQYYAANDSGGLLQPVTININSSTGAISSTSFGAPVTLSGRTDLEGVAYGGSGTVYVSDETGATITKYNVSGGSALSSVAVPSVYSNYVNNYSLESLTMKSNGLEMWTSNEEALTVDGPLSTASTGTVVRLQKFTRATTSSSWAPSVQYAYNTLSWGGDSGFTSSERSGVSDLCVLPNGNLLVLERRLRGSFIPALENNIYLIDTSAATDISGMSGLIGESYTAVSKGTALWSGSFGSSSNYEGLVLGQELDNGDYSLLMCADGDGSPNENFYALTIAGEIPEPATLSLLVIGGMALIRRKKHKV